ncbi:alpha-1A adrenergic receptor isoform X2 [Hydra vulgaris]|uniref:Alpha-1A adrenergic receptor isoform X2 n=1 Tax=Hydra vulgaris TaxID=6087 RepID=A0ABM4BFK4_HYDVU
MVYLYVFLSLVAILGVFCNGSILVSVIRYRILRKKHYALLVSLAVCDTLKILVIFCVIINFAIKDFKFCVITSCFGMLLIFVTTFHLAAESINRCLIIQFPYRYDDAISKERLAFAIFVLWFFPIFFEVVLPRFFYSNDWFESYTFQAHMFGCNTNELYGTDPYIIIVHAIFFGLPLLIMVISYGFMLHMAYKSAKQMRETQVRRRTRKSPAITETRFSNPIIAMVTSSYDTAAISSTNQGIEPIEHQTRTQSVASTAKKEFQRLMNNRKREIKASKTVVMIVFTFIACNAPTFSMTWTDMNSESSTSKSEARIFLIGLAFLQVFIDPIVYFLRLKDYKNARKTIKRVGTTMIRKTIRKL